LEGFVANIQALCRFALIAFGFLQHTLNDGFFEFCRYLINNGW